MVEIELKGIVKQIVDALVEQKYEYLDAASRGVRLTAIEMKNAIAEYGGTLTHLPESEYETLDVIGIENSHPQKWDVRVGLWTREEGKSDLTLELTIIDNVGNYSFEIDNIHVL
jgi:hypothetical protein